MKTDTYGITPTTGITDEEIASMAREQIGQIKSPVKAMRGKAIVWVAPLRKPGVIELPEDFRPNSVEAVMVSDGTGIQIPRGTLVMIRPDQGIIHKVDGVPLCFIDGEHLMLLQEA